MEWVIIGTGATILTLMLAVLGVIISLIRSTDTHSKERYDAINKRFDGIDAGISTRITDWQRVVNVTWRDINTNWQQEQEARSEKWREQTGAEIKSILDRMDNEISNLKTMQHR